MRKPLMLLLVATLFVALPIFAQDEMAPPEPLTNNEDCKWMIGEWEGSTESTMMGKTTDWQKVEFALGGQYMLITVKVKNEAGDVVYKGMGPVTINPENGQFVGHWFDNYRGAYKGTCKKDGNKFVWTWEGPMGKAVRTEEKVGDDKLVVTFKDYGPDGTLMNEGRSELTRKKKES